MSAGRWTFRPRVLEVGEGPGRVRIAWIERGPADAARTVVCVHGLTRNARDFDHLGRDLAARGFQVLQVDVAGRGRSGWLDDPLLYDLPVYARQLAAWLDALGLPRVDWVGTSMGGLVALELAKSRPRLFCTLVLNDIGPFVPAAALEPIAAYLGLDLAFPHIDALEEHLRTIHAGFGPLGQEGWRHLALHSARREGAVWRLHYDPRIREPFLARRGQDIVLWDGFDALACPVLVLRGETSAVLPRDVVAEMRRRRPDLGVVEFPGIGHAPALMARDQIDVVGAFLAGSSGG